MLRTVTGSEWRIGVRSLIALWLLFLACANWAAVAPSVRAVENQAFADFGDSNSKLASNIVRAMIFSGPPVIRYFSSNSFATPTNVATTGSPLFVQADAAACNVSRTTVETRTIVITSALTGDSESFLATESDADSGLFRILPNVPLRNSATAIAGDKIIQTIQNDVLTASIDGCGAGFGTTTILIDPSGIVFDSKTNRPIAGASVQLIDAVSRKPATVLGADGVSAASSSVITGADGRFQFPAVSSGDYKLLIIPPGGYRFPSVIAIGSLPSGHAIHPAGSYGDAFTVSLATGAVTFDVPIDPAPADGLFVEKRASRSVVEVGEFVDYTVVVKNAAQHDMSNVELTDRLPSGFAYQRGSARLAGAPLKDPPGSQLQFSLGALAQGQTAAVTYRVYVGPGALQGDGINRAVATAGGARSNEAQAKVDVQGGVFTDKAFIVGKVFMDCSDNGVQDADEPGIPGVRLYLENGTYVISDSEGKYSFYGVSPRTHVLKLDKTTLPRGAQLRALSNRNANAAGSQFVDVKNGELHRADFAAHNCTEPVLEQVRALRAKSRHETAETDKTLGVQLSADGLPTHVPDPRALPASGLLANEKQKAASFAAPLPAPSQPSATLASPQPVASARAGDLEGSLEGADNAVGFIGLKDKDTLPYAQTTVRVKGALGNTLKLTLNGEEISQARVGKKSTLPDTQLEAWEYIGINLKPGANVLEATQIDAFGNARGGATITLIAPDKLGKLQVIAPPSGAPADGTTAVKIAVKLTDDAGVAVTVRTPITLESSLGRFEVEDLNQTEPGVQTFIEGGSAEFALVPPREPGQALLRVSSGLIKAEARLDFLPELRPLIAAGVVEGTINLRNLNTGALLPARAQDGFENELKNFAYQSEDGKREAGGRAAFFLKGKIKGEYLLTAAYDSDKDTKERLFRDIQPDEFYPIYGDSAVRGFDAQSTSRLYVRVDKQKSYLLYGDFTTQSTSEARKLAGYERSLSGIKEHYENDKVAINAFASRDSTRQVVDEIRANGTSGPYELSKSSALANSEKVEILTRDRNQPSIVRKADAQTRFADYEIEPFTGRLLFRAPVPSLDADLNPISIRVTYEVDQGGDPFWVYGVDAQVKVTERLEVGGVFVEDRNPQDPATLTGVNATVKLAEKTTISAELAQTSKESLGTGYGERVEFKHQGERLEARAYWGKTDVEFDNPGANLGKGREEAGVKLAYRTGEKTRLIAEAVHTEDAANGGRRDGQLFGVEHTFANNVRAEVGVRRSEETAAPAQATSGPTPNEFVSVRTKLTAQVPHLPQATVFGEYEQDVQDSDRKLFAMGGDYRLSDHAKLYGRHEFVSSLSGSFALNSVQTQNTTVFGVDTDYMKDGHLFSEYRVRDAISGGDAEAAMGVRNLWHVAPGLGLTTNFERVKGISGNDTNESISGAFGMEYTANPLWKGSTRLELRNGSNSESALHTLGLAYKLNRDWSLLGKNIISLTKNKGPATGEKEQERFQLGVAYRDTATNVWNALARIEHKYEKDDTQAELATRRSAEILSSHVNYQPKKRLTLSGRYAAKWVDDNSQALTSTANAQLIGGRVTYDVNSHWDIGFTASSHFSNGFHERQQGAGIELGYLLTRNLWVSGGYNVFGYRDDELTGGEYSSKGAFLRLRYKFDEELFGRANSVPNNSLS